MSFNLPLIKAVQYLYGQGTIVKDRDIADKTGYNKATISGIINGKKKASPKFLKNFEKAFDIQLSDFSDGGSQETIIITDAVQLISESMVLLKAEAITNRQMAIEILAAVSGRSVSDVQLLQEKLFSHNLATLVRELKSK